MIWVCYEGIRQGIHRPSVYQQKLHAMYDLILSYNGFELARLVKRYRAYLKEGYLR
jgi:hypothetical protein